MTNFLKTSKHEHAIKPLDEVPVLDWYSDLDMAASSSLGLANCGVRLEDINKLAGSEDIDQLVREASQRLTMVHSVDPTTAEQILAEGYYFRGSPTGALASSFAHVVPDEYPNSQAINANALAYRHMGKNIKLVFQFPYKFPYHIIDSPTKDQLWGETELGEKYKDGITPYDDEVFKQDPNTGKFFLPSELIRAYIDLDNGEVTEVNKPEDKKTSRLRKIARKAFPRK